MRHLESQEQQALIRWARQTIPGRLLLHIPNGGRRDAREGHRLRLEGVVPGVPDLLLAEPVGEQAGLWIELKSKNGKLSQRQAEMLAELKKRGYAASVAHGWESAAAIITDYLRG